jgi:hypothetical protein
MAIPSITPTASKPGTFHAVYARPSGGKFQTLGGIIGGTINTPNFEQMDSMNRNRAFAVEVSAKCQMQQASLIELELLDSLCAAGIDFLFKLSDAAAIPSVEAVTEGWMLLTAAQVGIKPDVVIDGNISTTRKISLDWLGSLTMAEYAAAIKPSIAAAMFESSSDSSTFHTIGTYTSATDGGKPTPTHIVPNGLASITLADNAGGAAASLGSVFDFKLRFEYISIDPKEDPRNRYECFMIKVDGSYNWRSTDAANLVNLQTIAALAINAVITFASGLIATFTDSVGISTDYTVPDNIDKNRSIKIMHKGAVLTTSLDAIVSGS